MKLPKLSKFWISLIGDLDQFETEHRAFNAISILSFFIVSLLIPLNFYLKLNDVAFAISAALPILGLIYYFSRFRKRYLVGMTLYALLSYVLLCYGYFFNSGSTGSTLYFFILTFLLIIAFSNGRKLILWMVVHLFVITSLLIIEYKNPSLVPFTYENRLSQYFDIGISLIIVVIIVYFVITYLRHNYDSEKKIADERAFQIEQQNKQLNDLNLEKVKLLSILSHDLNSPLNSITSVLHLLTNYPLPETQRLKLQSELLSTTRNTSEMLANLLTWSSKQINGIQCKKENLNLKFIVDKVLQIQKPLAEKKEIKIIVNIDENIHLLADNNMLELTLRNIINNAIKFTHSMGAIFISANIDQDQNCQIVIRDNGLGMTKEHLSTLFTMDIHSTYGTENEKGIGLGLVLCKEFAEMQNGKLWAHSQLNNGSIFYLNLPTINS